MSEFMSSLQTVALDVGGTEMKGAVSDARGELTGFFRWPTPRSEGPGAVVGAVLDAVGDLLRRAPDARAVGLVVPGTVDDKTGVAVYSENIGWRDVPFRQLVADSSGLPVGFGHDVRAGGLAERTVGAARGSNDTLFMPIGTGISGAMFVEGRSIDNMYAGEIGHLDIGSPYVCACGAVGCLETVATGPSIARIYGELSGNEVSGAKPVVERMLAGDQLAATVWHGAIDGLARALASYVSLLAPDLIVIGGGLSSAGDALLTPLSDSLRSKLVWQQVPRIVTAQLGDTAGCVGADLLARRAYTDTDADADTDTDTDTDTSDGGVS
jgi:glucokinase